MRLGHISTYNFGNTNMQAALRGQGDLQKANYEAVNGRVYDPGLALGYKTSYFVHNENKAAHLTGLQETNNLTLGRMNISQIAMRSLIYGDSDDKKSVGALVQFNRILIGDQITSTPKTMQSTAQSVLDTLVSALNTSHNGEYVFGGTNTQEPPLDYYVSGSGEGTSGIVQQAFKDHFGFAPDAPEVADIKPDDLQKFIDGPFQDLFEEPSWSKNFSRAHDEVVKNLISVSGEVAEIGVSANEEGFRSAMRNLVMIAEFGDIGLSKEAQNTLSYNARVGSDDKATGTTIAQIVAVSARLGSFQAQVKDSNERLNLQKTVLNGERNDLIGVDQTEAAHRVTQIMTMLNISYNLTAKISHLSLINYL